MKTYYLEDKIFDLEDRMIPADKWDEYNIPLDMLDEARENSNSGIPTGFAYDHELGWCMLVCGQGPFIARSERG